MPRGHQWHITDNLQLGKEALDVFYGHTIRFESSATLTTFISQIPKPVLARLHSIALKNYSKPSARIAMSFLSEATNLQRLRIDVGMITNESEPTKAAKAIYTDLYKFLEAIGTVKGDKAAGVDVLSIGKQALTYKDKKNEARNYTEEMVEEFKEALKAKLK